MKPKNQGAEKTTKYLFRAKIWQFKGPTGWHFVTLPKSLAKKIRKNHGLSEEGWGRLKATARVGDTSWSTAIWYDTKAESYLLPIKSTVRKREGLESTKTIAVQVVLPNTDLRLSHWLKR